MFLNFRIFMREFYDVIVDGSECPSVAQIWRPCVRICSPRGAVVRDYLDGTNVGLEWQTFSQRALAQAPPFDTYFHMRRTFPISRNVCAIHHYLRCAAILYLIEYRLLHFIF